MKFNDFIHEFKSKKRPILNIEFYQFLSFLSLTDVGIYSRDGPFPSDIESVNLLPSK